MIGRRSDDRHDREAEGPGSSQAPLNLTLHSGRLRIGYFLLCACVALFGAWHWFGSSGIALAALWLEVRLRDALATPGGDVRLCLDQVDRVRLDPWRVTVVFSRPRPGPMRSDLRSVLADLDGFGKQRMEIFRDEVDAGTWSELRRRLLETMSPRRDTPSGSTQ